MRLLPSIIYTHLWSWYTVFILVADWTMCMAEKNNKLVVCVRECVCIAYMKQNNKFNWKGRMRANEMANERANERCARIRMRQWMRSQSERERLKLNTEKSAYTRKTKKKKQIKAKTSTTTEQRMTTTKKIVCGYALTLAHTDTDTHMRARYSDTLSHIRAHRIRSNTWRTWDSKYQISGNRQAGRHYTAS